MSKVPIGSLRAAVIASSIAAALAFESVALSGCGPSPGDPDAGGAEVDASFADVIEIRRDGAPGDAGAIDAGDMVDAAPVTCAISACDPRVDDCGSGVCVLADRLPECVSEVGDGTGGTACVSEHECAPGFACFRDGSTGVCARVCCPGDPTACDSGTRCSADGTLVTGIATSWGRCAAPRACDLRAPECPPREGCYIGYPAPGAECRLAGTAAGGDACAVPEDCMPGFHCAGLGAATCVRLCVLADPRSCPTAEGICVAQAYSPEGTGVCVSSARAW